jgi:hypothetical protein
VLFGRPSHLRGKRVFVCVYEVESGRKQSSTGKGRGRESRREQRGGGGEGGKYTATLKRLMLGAAEGQRGQQG